MLRKYKENTLKDTSLEVNIEEKLSQLSEMKPIEQNERGIKITEEFWGPLWQYVNDDTVTDIDYNGHDLRVRTTKKSKHRVDTELSNDFVEAICNRIANEVAKEFNVQNPILEAETDYLRISVVHETRNKRGKSICIRRVPKINRITPKSAIEDMYASPEMLAFLINCVHAHCNFTICGEIGSGKTELCKFLSSFIPDDERVITIEDNYELQYSSIKPDADCVELRVDSSFTYDDAIKASLRQNGKWLIIAEVRDKEAKSYLKQLSSGVNGITTLHTDDVRNIPSRIANMIGETESVTTLLEDAYTFLNIGIYLGIKVNPDGSIYRFIDQVCVFENNSGNHMAKLIYANGRPLDKDYQTLLPTNFAKKLKKEGVEDPFRCEEVDEILDKVIIKENTQINSDEEKFYVQEEKKSREVVGVDALFMDQDEEDNTGENQEEHREILSKKPRLKTQ